MAATAEKFEIPRRETGWLGRLLDSKPFLIFLCLLPALGILILGEGLSWNEPVGAVVVFLGILLAQDRLRLKRRN